MTADPVQLSREEMIAESDDAFRTFLGIMRDGEFVRASQKCFFPTAKSGAELAKAALTLPRDALAAFSLIERLSVMLVRVGFSGDDLRPFATGKAAGEEGAANEKADPTVDPRLVAIFALHHLPFMASICDEGQLTEFVENDFGPNHWSRGFAMGDAKFEATVDFYCHDDDITYLDATPLVSVCGSILELYVEDVLGGDEQSFFDEFFQQFDTENLPNLFNPLLPEARAS